MIEFSKPTINDKTIICLSKLNNQKTIFRHRNTIPIVTNLPKII